MGFPDSSLSKASACDTGDPSSIPGLRRSAGEGEGYPLQYSGLENSMDYAIHGVAKSLSDFHFLEEVRRRGGACWKECVCVCVWASQEVLVEKNLPANAGDIRDVGLIPGSGRSPGGRHGNSLQYSCLENPMDKGAWLATVHKVAKSWTRLK